MNGPINIVELVKALPLRPRGKARVVLTHDYHGQKEWAIKLAKLTNSDHLDFLEQFSKNENLGKQLLQFVVYNLFDYLKGRSEFPVLIISGLEFLKATWTGQDNTIEQFAKSVMYWNSKPCLLFVLQYDKALASYDFGKRFKCDFIIDQLDTLAL